MLPYKLGFRAGVESRLAYRNCNDVCKTISLNNNETLTFNIYMIEKKNIIPELMPLENVQSRANKIAHFLLCLDNNIYSHL